MLELAAALDRGWVDQAGLLALIDAREPALERLGASDPAELEAFAAATSGALQGLIYRALGGEDAAEEAAARAIGTALGLVGMARALGLELEHNAPGAPGRIALRRPRAEVAGVIGALTARSSALVGEGRRAAGHPARAWMAAFLPASLTTAYLGQPQRERSPLAPLALGLRVLLRRP